MNFGPRRRLRSKNRPHLRGIYYSKSPVRRCTSGFRYIFRCDFCIKRVAKDMPRLQLFENSFCYSFPRKWYSTMAWTVWKIGRFPTFRRRRCASAPRKFSPSAADSESSVPSMGSSWVRKAMLPPREHDSLFHVRSSCSPSSFPNAAAHHLQTVMQKEVNDDMRYLQDCNQQHSTTTCFEHGAPDGYLGEHLSMRGRLYRWHEFGLGRETLEWNH